MKAKAAQSIHSLTECKLDKNSVTGTKFLVYDRILATLHVIYYLGRQNIEELVKV